jgi:hypothetical protein
LITYPVATDSRAVGILGKLQQAGECEIGTHLHPWNTPPAPEAKSVRNSYISNLPPDLQYRKIKTLHETITRAFGTAPTSYRSGRWGFNEDVARALIRLGYAVDTSVYPLSDWSSSGGPDFTSSTLEPFVYRMEHGGGTLLEVPASIDFLQARRRLAAATYWTVKRTMPVCDKVLAGMGRLRLLNHVCLSPELARASHMIRLSRVLLDRGTKVLNMFFHSPSLMPKCSPFVRTEGDADDFFGRIGEFLAFARSADIQPATLSALTPETLGASRVAVI